MRRAPDVPTSAAHVLYADGGSVLSEIPTRQDQSVTVKLFALVALPPAVVTVIGPVVAPAGTFVSTSVSEITANSAATPAKATPVVCVRLTPFMVTSFPTGPFEGEKVLNCGVTQKSKLLSVPDDGAVT